MYSAMPMSAGPPIPVIPPNNFYAGPVYGNVPFHQPFPPTPFYPPVCNNYNPSAPPVQNCTNSDMNLRPQLPNVPLFPQPPPGYSADGQRIPHQNYQCKAVPHFQPVHMANVCSSPYPGFAIPNSLPSNNQFSCPPPPLYGISGSKQQSNNMKRNFSTYKNNRQMKDAKEFPYYCETCDRGFLNMNLFSEHKSQHITCGKEGCSFTGHPKIVEKHYMMQHRTGLFNRIVKGNSPEEIQKWITERKKHFPTKEKIEEKQAQRTEMDKRGERYVERQKSFNSRNNNFKSGSNNRFNKNVGGKQPSHKFKAFGKRGTFPRNKNTSEGSETKQKKREPIATDEEDCVVRNLPPFKGTAYYLGLETDGSVITDEDSVSIVSEYSDNCSDFINDCEDNMNGENVIAEMEKNSNDFIQEPDTECDVDMEADCLDKHFKCNDISRVDIGICDDKSENVDRITVGDKDIPSTFLVDNENVTFSRMNIAPSVDSPKIAEKPKQNVNNSLALIQCYDSEDDSDKDDTTDVKNCNQSSAVPEPSLKDDDDSGPEECSSKPRDSVVEIDDKLVNSNENGDSEKSNESKKRKRKRRRDSKSDDDDVKNSEKSISEDKMPQVFHARKRYRPPTLLEKLLSQEIKHERNTILQCVRYVVQSNYFNIGSSK